MFATLRTVATRGVRLAHTEAASSVPAPRGNIKDVADFMKAIGRDCEEFASKFETWESLFTTDSRTMRNEMGIPTRQRKYILAWREFYKQGKELHKVPLPKPKKKK